MLKVRGLKLKVRNWKLENKFLFFKSSQILLVLLSISTKPKAVL